MECILRERQPPNISVQNKFKVYLENNMTGYPLFQKSLETAFIFIFIYMTISSFLHLSVKSSVMSNSMTPWTVAHQAPPSMGFSRQEYWSGLPFPSATSIIRKELTITERYILPLLSMVLKLSLPKGGKALR